MAKERKWEGKERGGRKAVLAGVMKETNTREGEIVKNRRKENQRGRNKRTSVSNRT